MAHKPGAAFADYGAHHPRRCKRYVPAEGHRVQRKDETAKKRYGVIADYMHLGGNNDDEKVQLLISTCAT